MPRILVVDDDEQIRLMLRKYFESKGYDIDLAGDGKEALAIQEKQPADMVIADLILPEKEGLSLILDFRRDYPDLHIIAISGGGQIDAGNYLDFSKDFGAEAAFSKRLELDQLLEKVQELIG